MSSSVRTSSSRASRRRRSSIPRTPSAWNRDSTADSNVPARHRRRPSRVWPRQRRPVTRRRCSRGRPCATGASSTTRVTSSEPASGASSPPARRTARRRRQRSRATAVEQTSRRNPAVSRSTSPRSSAGLEELARLAALASADQRGHAGSPLLGHDGAGRAPGPATSGSAGGPSPPPAGGPRRRGRRRGSGRRGPASQRCPGAGVRPGRGRSGPREAPAAPAEPDARISFEGVREAEEEQHERDRPHHREQGFFDGHAAHRITPTGLSRSFGEAARYDAEYRNVNTFSGLRRPHASRRRDRGGCHQVWQARSDQRRAVRGRRRRRHHRRRDRPERRPGACTSAT